MVRERKAPIGMRLQREKSDSAEPGLGVAPSVAAPSPSESEDDAASASTSSSRSDSLRKSKSTLARTGEPIPEPSAADSAPDVPDVVDTRELARLRRDGVESYYADEQERVSFERE